MTYKTILVHVDETRASAARLDIAVELARRFEAHLVGLHAISQVHVPGYIAGEVGVRILEEIEHRVRREKVAVAEAMFRKAAVAAGSGGFEWRISGDDAVDATTLHARYADLVVLGQPNDEDNSSLNTDFAEQVVLAAGRPVLLVPYAGTYPVIGKRVLVGWNGGREATRALTDALPLLRKADKVDLVVFNPRRNGNGHAGIPGADIGLYLARHGVTVDVAVQSSDELDVGNQLLSRVADMGSDLIVMGAYGQPRLKQMILGGVTRTILESMTAPVLMSH